MIDLPVNSDAYLFELIKAVFLESEYTKEMDSNVAISIAILEHINRYGIQDPQFQVILDNFMKSANDKNPGEIERKLSLKQQQQNAKSVYNSQPIQISNQYQQQLIQQPNMNLYQQQLYLFQNPNPYQQQLNQQPIPNQFKPPNVVVDPVLDIKKKLHSLLDDIPNMTSENFINPFKETYNQMMSFNPGPITTQVFNYGRNLNFEQLKFVHKMIKIKQFQIQHTIQYLEICNGDVEAAEKLLTDQ